MPVEGGLSQREPRKTTLPAQKVVTQLRSNFVGEKLCFVSLPFPIFDLVHVHVHVILSSCHLICTCTMLYFINIAQSK